jgi:hypothetical protein
MLKYRAECLGNRSNDGNFEPADGYRRNKSLSFSDIYVYDIIQRYSAASLVL